MKNDTKYNYINYFSIKLMSNFYKYKLKYL